MQRFLNALFFSIWATGHFLCVTPVSAQTLDQLFYIADDSPPLNYLVEDRLTGKAVDLLEQATDIAGAPVKRSEVKVMPWARAYREALSGPHRVLFSVYRMPEREKLFKWAGPIDANRLVLIAKKSRAIKLDDLNQLIFYAVGAQREDASEHYLRKLKLDNLNLTLTVLPIQAAKMLSSDRIDIWAAGESGAFSNITAAGLRQEDFEIVGVLHKFELYFAFSRDVDDALVQQFQSALNQIDANHDDVTPEIHPSQPD
jgi:polar amino acid transport system substrate-binding protein